MGLKQKMKQQPALYNALLFILNRINYFDRQFHRRFATYRLTPYWKERIATVKASVDNQRIQHVDEAGKIYSDHQVAHNGLKISLGSYYDYGNTHLLVENKGVHEPQEEYAFDEILQSLPARSTMLELGSYWAFYSMWFASRVPDSKCFMVEPDPHKMNFGKLNFKKNNLSGTFDLGFISDKADLRPSVPFYSVDFLMTKHGIPHLTLLHSDIQGYELKMLEGADAALQHQEIDYFFISTHSNQLHIDCITKLQSHGYLIVCDANLDESYSVDGLIVAKRPGMIGPDHLEISKRTKQA
jgi:hypothetical protein